jgi:hypothetical protein
VIKFKILKIIKKCSKKYVGGRSGGDQLMKAVIEF